MSINDFTNKIKNKLSIDTFTIMCLLIIVGVGIGSFGLGRLSVILDSFDEGDVKIIDTTKDLTGVNKIQSDFSNKLKEKRYIASRNGKLYYTIECSGAKRISLKNAIWFSTEEEALKSGYEFSSSCK
jgi:uncharacterized protein YjhX (UPF0386 family)